MPVTDVPHRRSMTTSFLLLQADPGHVEALAGYVESLPGVEHVAVTSGPYDVVAHVASDQDGQERVRAAVRQAPGLSRISVCVSSRQRCTWSQALVSNA